MVKDNAQNEFEKAVRFAKLGLFAKAIQIFRRLLKALPRHPEINLMLAHALGLSGQRTKAKAIHQQLLKSTTQPASLHVRIARDLEEWQDFQGAISHWQQLSCSENQWQEHAEFHQARLFERCNDLENALFHWEKAQPFRKEIWGWYWLDGRLKMRDGRLDEARAAFSKGKEIAKPENEASCLAAIASVADRQGDFALALRLLLERLELRKIEAKKFRKKHPLPTKLVEFAERSAPEGPASDESLVFLTGLPRAGTTLLAHKISENLGLALSEEFPYLRHLVDQQASQSGKMPDIQKLASGKLKARGVQDYWEAQRQTVEGEFDQQSPLVDKNPAQGVLCPWIVTLIPNTRIIWMEREPRDLWISCLSVDTPLNAVTCWWDEPTIFSRWLRSQKQTRQHLSGNLPSTQFQSVQYETLVRDPANTISQLAQQLGLPNTNRLNQSPRLVTSPSYAEVAAPITEQRIERWKQYRDAMDCSLKGNFDRLEELLG